MGERRKEKKRRKAVEREKERDLSEKKKKKKKLVLYFWCSCLPVLVQEWENDVIFPFFVLYLIVHEMPMFCDFSFLLKL